MPPIESSTVPCGLSTVPCGLSSVREDITCSFLSSYGFFSSYRASVVVIMNRARFGRTGRRGGGGRRRRRTLARAQGEVRGAHDPGVLEVQEQPVVAPAGHLGVEGDLRAW